MVFTQVVVSYRLPYFESTLSDLVKLIFFTLDCALACLEILSRLVCHRQNLRNLAFFFLVTPLLFIKFAAAICFQPLPSLFLHHVDFTTHVLILVSRSLLRSVILNFSLV